MSMNRVRVADPSESFGELAAIRGGGRRAPDRRRVSLRWMAGSVLTGVTSLSLMGGALYAALDGRQELTRAPSAMRGESLARSDGPDMRGDRPSGLVAVQPISERILQVPTLTRTRDGDVIRKRPFAYATAPLAVDLAQTPDFPAFDPLTVFRASSEDGRRPGRSDLIYAADIESEVHLVETDFPLDTPRYAVAREIDVAQAERSVRAVRERLGQEEPSVPVTAYVDATRFSLEESDEPTTALGITIVAQNVSSIAPVSSDPASADAGEEVIALARAQPLQSALSGLEVTPASLQAIVGGMSDLGIDAERLPAGTRLRAAWERDPERQLRRLSVYHAGAHRGTVVRDDAGRVAEGTPPPPVPAVLERDNEAGRTRTLTGGNLPTVWDGLHRAALSQGLTAEHARQVVRTVAFDVDFRSRVASRDRLEVFYSLDEGAERASRDSQILYIGLTIGGRTRAYYRFRPPGSDTVGYYDAEGQTGRKFLLRQPVPNGKFRSGFGNRRHPITRRWKMHQGVDFSAPRGTPILSAGDGVVEKIGWAGGYGRQMILRHANGYKTSYNHMHRFARGMKKGARVNQGQVIGSVGSTGFSTGPHLHYEMLVNGARVNPMKIRLPQGKRLKGKALRAFQRERARIDALIEKGRAGDTRIASL